MEFNSNLKHRLPAYTIWADSNKYVQFRLSGGQTRCIIGIFDSGNVVSYYSVNWNNMTTEPTPLTEIKNGNSSQTTYAIKDTDGTNRIKLMLNASIGRTVTLVVYDVFSTIVEAYVSDI